MNASWLSLAVLGIGLLLGVICTILLVVVAFQKKFLWGIAVLFVPFASLIFTCLNWKEAKFPFLGIMLGGALIGGAIAMTPAASEAFWKQYNAQLALQHGQPPPPAATDLNAQIQEHRQRLETLQATFAQDGAEMTKQYQDLDAQRKALKPGDTAAITKFNETAAAYQTRNTARKLMVQQIATTQHELDELLDKRSRANAAAPSAHP
ncbi:hypothetical protein CfE428DRAFT_6661 [Chthoniobacter flavus Ellin428]|uniref:Uncharacterized protein n=1 Tax=Chthoniobacter flavus Ellin428 TaxID=497964 RepID=B4DCM0_9BACT|nr:transmembrane protein [Chthoniobacter flavus]EDY15808.1 hypothetical protein CfE428DRAFT_6661 [Chthoniobacter flavus Ellin428]TCO84241.1 hypothetical protein EV701_13735 [Chthoniobacter flavus]